MHRDYFQQCDHIRVYIVKWLQYPFWWLNSPWNRGTGREMILAVLNKAKENGIRFDKTSFNRLRMNRKNITGKHITKHWFSIQSIKLKIPSDNLVFNTILLHYYGIWRPYFLNYLRCTISDHYKNEQKLGSVQTEQN